MKDYNNYDKSSNIDNLVSDGFKYTLKYPAIDGTEDYLAERPRDDGSFLQVAIMAYRILTPQAEVNSS